MCKRLKAIQKVSEAADELLETCVNYLENQPVPGEVVPLRKAYKPDFDLPLEMAVNLRLIK